VAAQPGQPPAAEVWEVFARHDREDRVHHVGTVRAAGAKDARVFAFMLYDERRWQEMFVVPRSALVPVIVPE
jgi:1,2-phenylacetyl-CoA epoxidase PaaB subunit